MSEWIYDAYIPGTVVPQGSMSFYNGRAVHKPTLVKWRKHVNQHIQQWTGTYFGMWEPISQPVEVRADFFLAKAKANKDEYPVDSRKPDVDKALRGILDALSLESFGPGRLLADDRFVVQVRTSKQYAHGIPEGTDGHEPGVRLKVRKVE